MSERKEPNTTHGKGEWVELFRFFEKSDFDPSEKAAVMVKRRRRNRFWTCQSTLIRKSESSSRVAVKLKAFSRGEFKI